MFTTTGAISSILAALTMVIVLFVISKDEPPTPSYLLEKYREKEANDYVLHGILIQFIYAIVAGLIFTHVYVYSSFYLPSVLTQEPILTISIVVFSLVYTGIMILVGAKLWIEKIIELETSRNRVIRFLVSHIVYGLVLGLVFAHLYLSYRF